MAVQYNKLFKMLIDRKMTNNQLAKQAGVSLNIITRLKRDVTPSPKNGHKAG